MPFSSEKVSENINLLKHVYIKDSASFWLHVETWNYTQGYN